MFLVPGGGNMFLVDAFGQCEGLDNGKPEYIQRFCRVPAELGAIDAHEVDAVRNLRARITSGFCEAWDLAFHATTSCLGCA